MTRRFVPIGGDIFCRDDSIIILLIVNIIRKVIFDRTTRICQFCLPQEMVSEKSPLFDWMSYSPRQTDLTDRNRLKLREKGMRTWKFVRRKKKLLETVIQ